MVAKIFGKDSRLFEQLSIHIKTMDEQSYLSEEGYKKLEKDLQELKTGKRMEISKRIEEAKKLGDLSENSEYMEAKESQEFNERKIAEMENLFRNAVLISKHRKEGIVQIGSTVTVKKGSETMDFVIVGSEEADPASGKISNVSPLGSAFLDRVVGEKIEVTTPSGKTTYSIVSIK